MDIHKKIINSQSIEHYSSIIYYRNIWVIAKYTYQLKENNLFFTFQSKSKIQVRFWKVKFYLTLLLPVSCLLPCALCIVIIWQIEHYILYMVMIRNFYRKFWFDNFSGSYAYFFVIFLYLINAHIAIHYL